MFAAVDSNSTIVSSTYLSYSKYLMNKLFSYGLQRVSGGVVIAEDRNLN